MTGRPFHIVEFEHSHPDPIQGDSDKPIRVVLSFAVCDGRAREIAGGGFVRNAVEQPHVVAGSQLEAPVQLGSGGWTAADLMTLSAAAVAGNMGVYANATVRRLHNAMLLTGLTMGAMSITGEFASDRRGCRRCSGHCSRRWRAVCSSALAIIHAAGVVCAVRWRSWW